MKSVTQLYRVGVGPSSSHTMGPASACRMFLSEHPEIDGYKAVLYGSLAKTGKGHMTDRVIAREFGSIPGTVEFDTAKRSGRISRTCGG